MPDDVPTEEFLPILGANVARERMRCGLKQEEVAEHLGMSSRNYQRYEEGAVNIPATKLKHLAVLFECEETALMRLPEDGK